MSGNKKLQRVRVRQYLSQACDELVQIRAGFQNRQSILHKYAPGEHEAQIRNMNDEKTAGMQSGSVIKVDREIPGTDRFMIANELVRNRKAEAAIDVCPHLPVISQERIWLITARSWHQSGSSLFRCRILRGHIFGTPAVGNDCRSPECLIPEAMIPVVVSIDDDADRFVKS